MTRIKSFALIGLALCSLTLAAQKKCARLKPVRSVSLAIPEPSDICRNSISGTFFIVSDDGILYETDRDGKAIRNVRQPGCDFEAVYCDEHMVIAVDETHRNLWQYDIATLKLVRTLNIPYGGGRNKGYEAFTFNKAKNLHLIFTEKDPAWLFELDQDFRIVNQIDLSGIASDIASATYYDKFLWLLSDEDMTVLKLDPVSYEVVGKWKLPLINPEGFAFDNDGKLLVVCDDMQRLYYFDNPEQR